jgi:DNA-binding XRE family transcriptional regulator
MRTVELDLDPRPWTPAQVRALRTRLKASQPVFARLVGANVKTIQAWEQGKPPPPMARRLLDCIAKDLAPWEKILRGGRDESPLRRRRRLRPAIAAAIEPEVAGSPPRPAHRDGPSSRHASCPTWPSTSPPRRS